MAQPSELVRQIADPALSQPERAAAERDLCLLLAPRIRLYGLRHLRSEAAAADLVQEALMVLLSSVRAGKLEDPDHVERYLFGTCRNLMLHVHRSERQARAYEAAALPLVAAALPPAFAELDATRLAYCLGKLATREQRVVLLTFQEEQSAEEIAQELDTSAGNVRVLRHRAMLALQQCVAGAAA